MAALLAFVKFSYLALKALILLLLSQSVMGPRLFIMGSIIWRLKICSKTLIMVPDTPSVLPLAHNISRRHTFTAYREVSQCYVCQRCSKSIRYPSLTGLKTDLQAMCETAGHLIVS